MAFACTYAGIPFRMETPQLIAQIERAIPLADLCETMQPARWPGRTLGQAGIRNWPGRPQLRIGQLWYPVGASRWAEFHGLMTGSDVRAVMAKSFTHQSSGPVAQPLVLQADPGGISSPDSPPGITTNLFMLPPRPLSQFRPSASSVDDLYLITLVDERYYFHTTGVSLPVSAGGTWTWSQLLTTLTNSLGVTLASFTPAAAYGTPAEDSALWSTGFEDPGQLLDFIAFNVGGIFCRGFSGTYRIQTPTATSYRAQTQPWRLAGGLLDAPYSLADSQGLLPYLEAILPSTVTVVFPAHLGNYGYFVSQPNQGLVRAPQRYNPWIRDAYPDTFAVTVPLSSATGTDGLGNSLSLYKGNGFSFYIRDTAVAYFTNYSDASPTNNSNLTTLATQLANDYWNFLTSGNDEVYPGIRNWNPDPFHDLLFTYSGCRGGLTRVQRLPYNVWPQAMAHDAGGQAVDGPNAGPSVELIRANTSTPDGSGRYDAFVRRWTGSMYSDTEEVWLRSPDTKGLTLNHHYLARLMGFENGRKVYATTQGGFSGSVGVCEGDGTIHTWTIADGEITGGV